MRWVSRVARKGSRLTYIVCCRSLVAAVSMVGSLKTIFTPPTKILRAYVLWDLKLFHMASRSTLESAIRLFLGCHILIVYTLVERFRLLQSLYTAEYLHSFRLCKAEILPGDGGNFDVLPLSGTRTVRWKNISRSFRYSCEFRMKGIMKGAKEMD